MAADYGALGMSLYGSSKAAINLLTKVWAAEYGPSGVRVNAVSPGPTRTEGTGAMGEGLEQLAAQAPAGRPGTADEIAEAIKAPYEGKLSLNRKGEDRPKMRIVLELSQKRDYRQPPEWQRKISQRRDSRVLARARLCEHEIE